MNQLIQVPFEGDTLHAIKTGDSEDMIFVSVRKICQVLGMSEKVQLRKLASCAWADSAVAMQLPSDRHHMETVAKDGRKRTMVMISLKSLPLWLATISPQRVRPDVAEKLKKYQMQCRDVLYRHFFGVQEEKRPAIAEVQIGYWDRNNSPNQITLNRLRNLTDLVEKHDQMMMLEYSIACERLGLRLELSKLGLELECC